MPPKDEILSQLSPRDVERFWSGVDKNGPLPDQTKPFYAGLKNCWVWKRSTRNGGYGQFGKKKRQLIASRVAWAICRGNPNGERVLHKCDNPLCVRLDHLFLGTPKDNTQDAIKKNRLWSPPKGLDSFPSRHPERMARGVRLPQSKLNDEFVRSIRKLRSEGRTQSSLGTQFGVDQSVISDVVNKVIWRHVL